MLVINLGILIFVNRKENFLRRMNDDEQNSRKTLVKAIFSRRKSGKVLEEEGEIVEAEHLRELLTKKGEWRKEELLQRWENLKVREKRIVDEILKKNKEKKAKENETIGWQFNMLAQRRRMPGRYAAAVFIE